MSTERILILVKPDGVRRNLVGEVLRRIEAKGYTLENIAWKNATEELLSQHYNELVDKPFYPDIVSYMTSGPIVAAVFNGAQIVKGVRNLAGATDPTSAAPEQSAAILPVIGEMGMSKTSFTRLTVPKTQKEKLLFGLPNGQTTGDCKEAHQ